MGRYVSHDFKGFCFKGPRFLCLVSEKKGMSRVLGGCGYNMTTHLKVPTYLIPVDKIIVIVNYFSRIVMVRTIMQLG